MVVVGVARLGVVWLGIVRWCCVGCVVAGWRW